MLSMSLKEMVKGRWREFCREPSALIFVILMPIMWMLILGLALSKESNENIRLGLIHSLKNPQQSVSDTSYQSLVQQKKLFSLKFGTKKDLLKLLKDHKLDLIVEVQSKDSVHYYLAEESSKYQSYKELVHSSFEKSLGRQDKLIAASSYPFSHLPSRYVDFLIPGLLALSLLSSSLFGTGITIVSNRREKLLKRYLTTPMRPYEYIFSHLIGRYLVFAVEMTSLLSAAWLFFDFQIRGSFLSFFFIAFLSAASFTALALLLSSRAKNTSAYHGFMNLLLLPMMLLSGVWFSKDYLPDFLRQFSEYLPVTACVDSLRMIALEGQNLSALNFQIFLLLTYLLLFSFLARKFFRWV